MPNFDNYVKEKNKAMLEGFGRLALEDIEGHEIYQEVEASFGDNEEQVRETIISHRHFLETVKNNRRDYVAALAGKKQPIFTDVVPDDDVINLQNLIEEINQKQRENDNLLLQNQKEDDNIPVINKAPSELVKELRKNILLATNKESEVKDELKKAEEELVLAQTEKDNQERKLKKRINDKVIEAYAYNGQLLELQQQNNDAREKLSVMKAKKVEFEEEKDYYKAEHSKDEYYKNATLVYEETEKEINRNLSELDEKAKEIIHKLEKTNNELDELKAIKELPIEQDIANINVKIEAAKEKVQKAGEDLKKAKEAEVNQLEKEENERLNRLETVQKCYAESDRLDKAIGDYEFEQNQIADAKLATYQKESDDLATHDAVKEILNRVPLRTYETIVNGAKALKDVYDRFKQEHGFFARWFKSFKSFDVGKDYDKFSAMRDRFIEASGINKEDINRYLDGKPLRNKLKEAIDAINNEEKEAQKDDVSERIPVKVDINNGEGVHGGEIKVKQGHSLAEEQEKEINPQSIKK